MAKKLFPFNVNYLEFTNIFEIMQETSAQNYRCLSYQNNSTENM